MAGTPCEQGRPGRLAAQQATVIAGLVEVAPGAIVSRELARSSGGTLTIFALAAGQGLSEHTAPFDALVQVVEGRLDLSIGGEPVAVAAGEIVLMPAHVPHAVHAPVAAKMLLTMLRELGATPDEE
jgi:quercetin dioxygenase-like cupin family protein